VLTSLGAVVPTAFSPDFNPIDEFCYSL
jgi:hypothetical protein